MLRSLILRRWAAFATVLTFALLVPRVALGQAPEQPFNYKACIAKGELSPDECSISACMSRPYLNREQCVCLRHCALGTLECIKQERDAGVDKMAAQISCDVAKDKCAKECVAKHR